MYDYFLPQGLKNFIDSIFTPPISFLNMAREYLDQVGSVAGRGINLNNYFGFFNYLPSSMQVVVNSLLASIVVIAILQMVKYIMRAYYAVKDGAQWW